MRETQGFLCTPQVNRKIVNLIHVGNQNFPARENLNTDSWLDKVAGSSLYLKYTSLTKKGNNGNIVCSPFAQFSGREWIVYRMQYTKEGILILFLLFRWPMDPQTINAMYSFNENEISKSPICI